MNSITLIFSAIGLGLIYNAVRISKKIRSIHRELDKYEFEHRNTGGIVEFPNFEAAEKHKKMRASSGLDTLRAMSLGFGIFSLLIALGALVFSK